MSCPFSYSTTGEYTFELLNRIVTAALANNLDEIYLLEHTHQFSEFAQVYKPIAGYNQHQANWLSRKMDGTIDNYLNFIELVKKRMYPITIRFGLKVAGWLLIWIFRARYEPNHVKSI